MQNNIVYKLTEAQKCTNGGISIMNENKHTSHVGLIGQTVGQRRNLFEDIIVAGTQQRSRSGQVARQLETSPLSREAINIYANNAYKASIRLDYIRRHDIEYFRPLMNKELSSVILSLPFTSFARHKVHKVIQNYLRQRQINEENNAILAEIFRDELIKSGFAKYGLSSPSYQPSNMALIETVQSVLDII